MQRKLQYQRNKNGVIPLETKSLEPYPGYFLRRNTLFKFVVSSFLSVIYSVLKSRIQDSIEYLKNIKLSLSDVHNYVEKHYKDYFDFKERWAKTMPLIREDKPSKDYLEKNRRD